MLVCHCCVVNEGRIREEIARGARDEVDIGRACGAGTGCGGCVPLIRKLLGECVECPLSADAADRVSADAADRVSAEAGSG